MYKEIKLYPHNEKTYSEVMNYLSENNFDGTKAAICNCTGLGKSMVIMKVMHEFISMGKKNILLLAPTWEIIQQFRQSDHFPYLSSIYFDIYPSLMKKNMKSLIYYKNGKEMEFEYGSKEHLDSFKTLLLDGDLLNFDLIIFDELHRTGAKEWAKAINILKILYPHACLLGASATPRRFDQKDQENDQVDEMFEGHRCGNISLYQALKDNLLPLPTYVTSLYTIENEIESYIKRIQNNEDLNYLQKQIILDEINESKINWSASHGYDETLTIFLRNSLNIKNPVKILVFCKNEKHIREIRKAFDPIFRKIFKDAKELTLEKFTIHGSKKPFEYFRDITTPNTAHVLYSINKFNEGLHIKNLNCIIMLRGTESENVYYQQIGRCLSIDGSSNPLIIDFVNNFKNMESTYKLWNELLPNSNFDEIYHNGYNWSNRDINVRFYNEVQQAIDLFKSLDNKITIFEKVEYNGETNTVDYFCQKYHRRELTVKKNMSLGLNFKTALEISPIVHDEILNYYEDQGTLRELCKKFKKNYSLMEYRVYTKGMSVEEAFDM